MFAAAVEGLEIDTEDVGGGAERGGGGNDRADVGGFELRERDILAGARAAAGSGLEFLDGLGEMALFDMRARAGVDKITDDLAKFAEISGPGITGEGINGVAAETEDEFPGELAEVGELTLGEERDIAGAFAERQGE